MGFDLEEMTYLMAAEKMVNMLFAMEQTLEFMIEHKIKPDNEVKKALIPILDQMKKWVETK